ncbi:hypothetical protein H6G95_20345 [Nostoc linckia FACHB-391]|uniref:Uncharacterized protein n=2 Tax=Nostoc TaxID=1177 RepID=A0ABR8IDB4_9NOSO|nr:hypothetical protein [Nostoc linckia FACHB-391]MBD2648827.1 hypothetical protein [Nostoc foliaceum FACHB-393]
MRGKVFELIAPEESCDTVLEKSEWQSLCATINKNPTPPDTPPYLRLHILVTF